jgi:hypothetical protein
MSEITLAGLLASDPNKFHTAAAAWQRMAQRIDDAAEELIRGTRELEDVWPEGPASQSAHAKTRDLCAEVSNTYPPARRIAEALDHHGYALARLKQQAEDIIARARANGFTVDPAAGTVTAPPEAYQGGSAPTTARAVGAVVSELQEILDRVRQVDSSTANAINANLPDSKTGFGRMSLPPIDRAKLEEQFGRPPADVKKWWDSLTPAQQEQAIRDFPELVGWLDGIPASDRDAANRLRPERHLDELQAYEDDLRRKIAELEARGSHDTAAQNELATLRQNLDAVEREQKKLEPVRSTLDRLGDNGFLLGFRPAARWRRQGGHRRREPGHRPAHRRMGARARHRDRRHLRQRQAGGKHPQHRHQAQRGLGFDDHVARLRRSRAAHGVG